MLSFVRQHKRALIIVIQFSVAVVAVAIALRQVAWTDRVYVDGQRVRVLDRQQGNFVVEIEGHHRTVAGDEVRQQNGGPEIEYGVYSIVAGADWRYLVLGMAVFLVVPFSATRRWQILLHSQGVGVSYAESMRLWFAGSFANFFLIGTTGGDALKALWLSRHTDKGPEVFVATFVDRVLGVLTLTGVSVIWIMLFWNRPYVADIAKVVAVLFVGMLVGVGCILSHKLRRLLRVDSWIASVPGGRYLVRIDQAVLVYRNRRKTVLSVMGYSLLLQLSAIFMTACIGRALGIDASVIYYLIYTPLAFMVAALPISAFMGLGLLENAFVVFFATTGLATGTQAAMLAVAARLVHVLYALPGAYVIARGRWHSRWRPAGARV